MGRSKGKKRNQKKASSAQSTPDANATKRQMQENWRNTLTEMYPTETGSASGCSRVPYLHLNKVPYRWKDAPGTSVPTLVVCPPKGNPPSPGSAPSADGSDSSSGLTEEASPSANQPSTRSAPSAGASGSSIGLSKPAYPPSVLLNPTEGTKFKNVCESDPVDDFAQHHLLINLHAMGKRLPGRSFIISQFKFSNFSKHPAFRGAVKLVPDFPNLKKLDNEEITYSNGDADVVLFHRSYGVLIVEMKAVGYNNLVKNLGELDDEEVKTKMEKSFKQLYKSETVIRYLMSDFVTGMTIRKALCFPYIRPTQLHRILTTDHAFKSNLCQCLGVTDVSEAVQLCLCVDRLSDHKTFYKVPDTVLDQLTTWWGRLMTTPDPQLMGADGENLFLDIVARFVIPCCSVDLYTTASPRVEIATGQAVAELGRRLSKLVLTEQELNLLAQPPNFAFLHGPPGTGKSVLLVLHALRCLMEGRDVHIVSTRRQTLAASFQIENQLQETVRRSAGSSRCGAIQMHVFDFDKGDNEVEKAVEDLTRVNARDKTLCIFMDEVVVRSKIVAGPRTKNFLKKLMDSRPDKTRLRIWCAGAGREEIPDDMEGVALTTPLRSAPSVRREVDEGLKNEMFSHVPKYNCQVHAAPADGPEVVRIQHHTKGGPSCLCDGEYPVECEHCGRIVAAKVRSGEVAFVKRFRDVFIITRSSELCDEVKDGQGQVRSQACGFVRGLRAERVPVSFITLSEDSNREELIRKIRKVVRAEDNEVTVTTQDFLLGLERRVVVQLVGMRKGADEQKPPDQSKANDRVFGASRCTTQLIIVQACE